MLDARYPASRIQHLASNQSLRWISMGARKGRSITEDHMAMAMTMATRKAASPEEIAEVWKEFKADQTNKALRNRLIEQYLPLVKYNGERIWSRLPDGVELDDLISAGVFGLMDAINAFDLTRGVKFETYCVPRIRGAMLDELRR